MVTSWTWLSRWPAPLIFTNLGLLRMFDGAAHVAHGGAQAAHQLVDDAAHRAAVRHAAFDAFRHQLVGGGGVLK